MTNDTLLHRQVHPQFVHGGEITSQVFDPTRKDEGKLSVDDGDLINPEDAWIHHTEVLNLESAGVMSVTVGECSALDLDVYPDPLPEHQPHAVIDFNKHEPSQIKKKVKKLKAIANERGWQYENKATSSST